jgi:A/G-specific adenine glycosylase
MRSLIESGTKGKKLVNVCNNLPRLLEDLLLSWYDQHHRALPWRAAPGHAPNPYHVWLSEIMLQQTTVATVKDYFAHFVSRWPTVDALAHAELDEVFHAWQGLGYYSRARNLHGCAQILVRDFGGKVPEKEAVLLTLPGIGPYTAAAIAAIAFEQPTVPVDGNIVRVLSRLNALKTPLPNLKKEVQALVPSFVPQHRRGDFAQSLMDLGATLCRPRNPACDFCPWMPECKAYRQGIAAQLPRPAPKNLKPTRYGTVFWVENHSQEIMLEKRPDKGLLAGLIGLPTTPWRESIWTWEEALQHAPAKVATWENLPLVIQHTFTHFHLKLTVARGITSIRTEGIWSSLDHLKSHAIPTLMKKVIRGVATL